MGKFEAAIYTVFACIPLVAVVAIQLHIVGIIKKKKNQNPQKYFKTARILLWIVLIWFIGHFVVGMIGFGPGRFDS